MTTLGLMQTHDKSLQMSSENEPLVVSERKDALEYSNSHSFSTPSSDHDYESNRSHFSSNILLIVLIPIIFLSSLFIVNVDFSMRKSENTTITNIEQTNDEQGKNMNSTSTPPLLEPIGPYKLIEKQEGMDFFDYYNFYNGSDSEGSAGYNTYVSREEGERLGIFGVVVENDSSHSGTKEEIIYMNSSSTLEGPRSSIRLEGKTRFDRGLFILDLRHMPNGAGVWPAFWLTVSFSHIYQY
jgi:hypothetical protein